MIGRDSPLARRGDNEPGLRNQPFEIKQKSQARDIKQEDKTNKKWFKHFFDDLGSVANLDNIAKKSEVRMAKEYKLTREQHKFVRGSPLARDISPGSSRIDTSLLENRGTATQYAAHKQTLAKDIRNEALGYLIRNRNILNAELSFSGAADRKFKEELLPKVTDGFGRNHNILGKLTVR